MIVGGDQRVPSITFVIPPESSHSLIIKFLAIVSFYWKQNIIYRN